jgi:hypothetical protein
VGAGAGAAWVRVRRGRGCVVGAGADVAWMRLGGGLGLGFRELDPAIGAWRLGLGLGDCGREGWLRAKDQRLLGGWARRVWFVRRPSGPVWVLC